MSEKLSKLLRTIKEYVMFGRAFFPVALFCVVGVLAAVVGYAAIEGFVCSFIWNSSVVQTFGLQKLTVLNAFLFLLMINLVISNYVQGATSTYKEIKIKFFDPDFYKIQMKNENEKNALNKKAVIKSLIITAVLEVILVLLLGFTVKYSWNSVLPKILNCNLSQISFFTAVCMGLLVKWFYSKFFRSNSNEIKVEDNRSKVRVYDMYHLVYTLDKDGVEIIGKNCPKYIPEHRDYFKKLLDVVTSVNSTGKADIKFDTDDTTIIFLTDAQVKNAYPLMDALQEKLGCKIDNVLYDESTPNEIYFEDYLYGYSEE